MYPISFTVFKCKKLEIIRPKISVAFFGIFFEYFKENVVSKGNTLQFDNEIYFIF